MLKRSAVLVAIFVSVVFLVASANRIAEGQIQSCSASVTPHAVAPSSLINFQFEINNDDSNPIVWIRVTRPSANFSIQNSDISGWNGATPGPSYTTQTGGNLDPGDGLIMSVTASTAGVQASAANWTVQVSDDPGGANPFSCSGALDTAISGSAPDTTPPNIYNVSVSNLRTISVTINWSTDEPATSRVDYGLDESYGESSDESGSLVTSHSVNLSGLTADTAYHYQVVSRDGLSNEAVSSDNTFITPLTDPIISEDQPVFTKIPLKETPTEFIPPVVKLNTIFTQPFKQVPLVTGTATDNEAVAGIEYSIDGGQNWLPVDKDSGLGGKKATFSFTPLNLEDGNYAVLARAIDTSSNIGKSDPVTMVIDRLPPLTGGYVMNIGPQILEPKDDSRIVTTAGVDQGITMNAVGGPTSITLTAADKTFSLTKSADNGLWSGVIGFSEAGNYQITADAVDGAGNQTSRVLSNVTVLAPGQTIDEDSRQPISAEVTVYYLEPESNEWVVWDGPAYGQKNPQKTDEKGNFSFLLPPAKYYLQAEADGYQTLTSSIFEINQPMPVSEILALKKAFGLHLGPINIDIPDFSIQKIDPGSSDKVDSVSTELMGRSAPDFALSDTNAQSVSRDSLAGKPTVITMLATWSPQVADQLAALSKLQANSGLNILPVGVGENAAKLQAYSTITGYRLTWLADPDNSLAEPYQIQNLPTHYFIDSKGIIQKVVTGLLSEEEITQNLAY